jgi:DNA adenine methylase
MPKHIHYCEPFFGGGSVLLSHSGEGRSELVNDINAELTGFWRVLQDPATFVEFSRRLEAMPLSRVEWDDAGEALVDDTLVDHVSRAISFFVRCRQSLAGRMKSFTPPTRTRLRRQMNGNVSEWLGAVEGLVAVHTRLRRVFIENMDAVKLIKREDTPGTLVYCDPPYLASTRTAPDVYAHEMSVEQHQEFLVAAKACVGKVMISGYSSDLYEQELSGWTQHVFDIANNAAGGLDKRRMTEVLWCNF